MKLVYKFFAAGILSIFIGLVWMFLFSYKGNALLDLPAYAFLALGCYIITYQVIGRQVNDRNVILKIVFLLLFAGGFSLFSTLSSYHYNYILSHYLTKTTIASVMGSDINSAERIQTVKIITFRYYVQNVVVEQDISNSNHDYKVGQSFLIRYSVEYPEVFKVIKQVDQ